MNNEADLAKITAGLNLEQRAAVEQIYGPVMVLAGPGTGKTELLARRVANILAQTDAAAENVLCLTFTEAAAVNMTERLAKIIGRDAYRVPVFTFHGFGSFIMQQNREYFFSGAEFSPIEEITGLEILREIFEKLPLTNPLAKKFQDEWIFLKSTKKIISDIKKAGLNPDEMEKLLSAAQDFLTEITPDFRDVFAEKLSKKTLDRAEILLEKAENFAKIAPEFDFSDEPSLAEVFARSLENAIEQCRAKNNKTTDLKIWRDDWAKKDAQKNFVLKDFLKIEKLRAANEIYREYRARLMAEKFYDFDDMILETIAAIRENLDLKFDLQEKFQFILVDEFQDTNDAQARLLDLLTDYDAAPNVMVVGDDDQAIYRFQGANVSNLQQFMRKFADTREIILRTNYRSDQEILTQAQKVAAQISDRLNPDAKNLTPYSKNAGATRKILATTLEHENQFVAREIAKLIQNGENPAEIAVIARGHKQLKNLLPFFAAENIAVDYEKNENILSTEPTQIIREIAQTILLIQSGDQAAADEFLPGILAHEAFDFAATDIWRISLKSYETRRNWLEIMCEYNKETRALANWLIELAKRARVENFEKILDDIIGNVEKAGENSQENAEKSFISPLFEFHFGAEKMRENPEEYFTFLNNLLTLRDKLREFHPEKSLRLRDFVEFLNLSENLGQEVRAVARLAQENCVKFFTAHGAKGLEFNHVFVIAANSEIWGAKSRGRSENLSWPHNLPFSAGNDTIDEKIRLFFVAMTRARHNLTISYAKNSASGKALLPLEFVDEIEPEILPEPEISQATEQIIAAWSGERISEVAENQRNSEKSNLLNSQNRESVTEKPRENSTNQLREILAPRLKKYCLSATHLNNFLDMSRGGPQYFLQQNLLHFPAAKSANAAYGTAVHGALQKAHSFFNSKNIAKETEQFMLDFRENLRRQKLDAADEKKFLNLGEEQLPIFYEKIREKFNKNQRPEVNAGPILLDEARISGKLDVLEIDPIARTVKITDYKTGNPAFAWNGGADYEKIKLRKYRQQLLFYYLLIQNAPEFRGLAPEKGVLQFIKPDRDGEIHALEIDYREARAEIANFEKLVLAVWRKIMTLEFLEWTDLAAEFSPDYKGMIAFEEFLLGEEVKRIDFLPNDSKKQRKWAKKSEKNVPINLKNERNQKSSQKSVDFLKNVC